ncbi:hypothetical protein C8Q73DRAFT_617450, partial [Cubamyces lactineus]
WATDEQAKWLKGKLPEFVQSQRKNRVDKFFEVAYSEWFRRFPLEEPTEEEVQKRGGNQEKARSKKTKLQHKRIRWWFYNRARGSSTKRILDLGKKRTGYLHPYQAYLKV